MNEVFRKLQFNGEERIYVRGAPAEFKPHLEQMRAVTKVSTSPTCKRQYGFAIFFVKSCAEIARLADKAAGKLDGDGVLWFAYPKKSSKRYSSDIGRDDGWIPLGDHGFEGVRQIAIDEDWSAIRFRQVDYIKSLKRDPRRALTSKGKRRAKKGRA
jgi:hypothetical protein